MPSPSHPTALTCVKLVVVFIAIVIIITTTTTTTTTILCYTKRTE
jgi:hypothetical protein